MRMFFVLHTVDASDNNAKLMELPLTQVESEQASDKTDCDCMQHQMVSQTVSRRLVLHIHFKHHTKRMGPAVEGFLGRKDAGKFLEHEDLSV